MNYKSDGFLVIGRFQSFTKSHYKLISMALDDCILNLESLHLNETIVGIVNGDKSSKNKKRNPFRFGERVRMIRNSFPDIRCLKLSSGFIGEILDVLYGSNYNLKRLYIGGDRKSSYEDQLRQDSFAGLEVQIITMERENDISATKVREALLNNDEVNFQKLTPIELHRNFEKLRKIYQERIKNG